MLKATLKKALSLALASSMLIMTTACSSSTAPSSSEVAPPSGSSPATAQSTPDAGNAPVTKVEKVTILTFNPADEKSKALLDTQKKLFEEKYPGVTLEITTGDVTIEGGKLTTMLNSGINLPDVINVNSGPSRIGMLAKSGTILPLDELYRKNGWADKVNPGALSLRSLVDGKAYEVPNTMDAISCYYNKEIFKELGLSEPKTYDEFLAICEKTKAAGYEPISLGARDGYAVGWLFGNLLQSSAGTTAAKSLVTDQSKWTDPTATAAITMFDDFIKKGYISQVSSTRGEAEALYAFMNKKAAMYFVGTWVLTTVYDNNMHDKIGTFVLPSQKNEKTYPTSGLGNSWVIPAAVKDTAAAELWIDFLLSDELAQMFASYENNNSIYTSKAFSDADVKSPLLKQAKASIADGAGCNPSVFIGVETKNAYFQNLQGLVAGLGTPAEVAANIQSGQDKDLAG